MPTFTITSPDGKRSFTVSGDSAQGAYAALSQHLSNGAPPPSDGPQTVASDGKGDSNMIDGGVAPSTYASDVAQSLGSGVISGAEQLAALPRTANDAIRSGAAFLANKAGLNPAAADAAVKYNPLFGLGAGVSDLAQAGAKAIGNADPALAKPAQNAAGVIGLSSTNDIQQAIQPVTGPLYQPQTVPGQYAKAVGEFLPNAAVPGGLVRKAASVVLPAVASEAAGETAKAYAPDWENAARFAGAIAGGGFTAGTRAGAENAILDDLAKTTPELQASKNAAYENAANTLGKQQVPAQDFAGFVRQANKMSGDAGIGGLADASSRSKLSGTMQVVDEMTGALKQVARGESPPPTFADLETWRQNLNSVKDGSIGNTGKMSADGYFANQIINQIDNVVGNSPYSDARQAFSTLRKVQTLDDAISKAQNSENVSQALQSQFKKILNSNVTNPQFSPAEVEQIRQVANGGFKGNIPSLIGKLGIGADYIAGQIGRSVGGLGGEATGMIASNLTRAALRKTGQSINNSAGEAAATRARNLVAMANKGGIADRVTAAGNQPALRRMATGIQAQQNADQGSGSPGGFPGGLPVNALQIFASNMSQPQNALTRFAR